MGSVFLVLLTMVFSIFAFRHKPNTSKIKPGSYYDKGSGETVSNPAGKTPETFGGTVDTPIFLGFDDLLTIGVSKLQLDAIKKAFDNYSKDGNKHIKEVSVTIASIKRVGPDRDSNEPGDIVTFDVTLDRKQTFKAKVESQSLTVSRLYLSDPNGKLVFDSYDIDASTAD